MGEFTGSGMAFDPLDEGTNDAVVEDNDYKLPSSFRDALAKRLGDERADEMVENEATGAGDDPSDAEPTSAGGDEGSSPLLSEPPEHDDGDGDETNSDTEPVFELGDDEPPNDTSATADSSTPVITDDLDLNTLLTDWNGGVKPDRSQIVSLLGFVQQVASLPPEQQRALDAILRGQAPDPTLNQPAGVTPPAPVETPLLPDNLDDSARELLEPIVNHQRELENRLRQYEAQTQQATIAAQQQVFESGVRSASEQFVKDYSGVLSTNDLVLLESRTMTSGQFPLFLAQNGNDPAKAYRALLEYTAFSDEALKSKIFAAQTAASAEQTAKDTTRVRKASAVAAGGSVKPTRPAPKDPETKEQRHAAAVDLLRSQMGWDS